MLSGKVDSEDIDINIGLGLTEFLNTWVKKQHKVKCQLTNGLTEEQVAFLYDTTINPRKYGCILPPSIWAMLNRCIIEIKNRILPEAALVTKKYSVTSLLTPKKKLTMYQIVW